MEEKKYYVYVYLDTRKEGNFIYGDYSFNYEPFYVGKGKNDRYKEHLRECRLNKDTTHKSNLIKKIIRNGGYPEVILIENSLTETEALELEVLLIKVIGRFDLKIGPLTNKTDGGDGISGYKWTDEQKLGIKGRKTSRLGVETSDDHKKKISEANKGKTWSDDKERVVKFSNLKKEQCAGENNPFFGKHHSEETLKKTRKEIIMYDYDMVKIGEYKSLTECSKITDFPISKISSVANGKIKHYKKFKFEYK